MYNKDEDQTGSGMAADEMENADLIEAVDEDGNKVLLEVIRFFFYNGEEYVILGDVQQVDEDHDHCNCGHEDCADEAEVELYIMKVVSSEEDDEMEEFVPVEDDNLLEQLIHVAEATFDEEPMDGEEDETPES